MGFTCKICTKEIDDRFGWDRRYTSKPPICRRCEQPSYPTWNGSSRSVGLVKDGSLGDRRMARRLYAIADAINGEANRQNWRYGIG